MKKQVILKFEDHRKRGDPKPVDPEAPAIIEIPDIEEARARETRAAIADELAAWEAELERATADRLQRGDPTMTRNRAEAMALVMDDDDGQTVWVAVGGTIRYAVNKRNHKIREAGDNGPVKIYCNLSDWASWEWGDYYPWRKEGT